MRMSLDMWVALLNRGRPFLHLSDMMKLGGLNRETARKNAQRLLAKGILLRVGPELYANGLRVPTIEQAACVLRVAYVSFEHALFLHGMLDQAPYIVTCATLGRPGRVKTDLGEIEYHRLARRLFTGFETGTDGLFASPEKALLDLVYLRLRRGEEPLAGEWNFAELNRGTLAMLAKDYPKTVRAVLATGPGGNSTEPRPAGSGQT